MPPKKDPGRDPEMAERTRALNVVFALSSIALLVSMTWMIWADYDREWKRYQIDFNRFEIHTVEFPCALQCVEQGLIDTHFRVRRDFFVVDRRKPVEQMLHETTGCPES